MAKKNLHHWQNGVNQNTQSQLKPLPNGRSIKRNVIPIGYHVFRHSITLQRFFFYSPFTASNLNT